MMKLEHTRIVTADVRKLAKFYEALTGITASGSDEYLTFDLPGGGVAVSSAQVMSQQASGEAQPSTNRTIVLDFEVDDIHAAEAHVRRLTRAIVQGPTLRPWDNRSMLFRDPDGNLINVFSRGNTAQNPNSDTVITHTGQSE